jgi:hypothetical protein
MDGQGKYLKRNALSLTNPFNDAEHYNRPSWMGRSSRRKVDYCLNWVETEVSDITMENSPLMSKQTINLFWKVPRKGISKYDKK